MKLAIIICSGVVGIVSLVIGLPLAHAELTRWPKLLWLERNRLVIAGFGAVIVLISIALGVIDESRSKGATEVATGSRPGQLVVKSTAGAAESEIAAASHENADEALRLFVGGDALMRVREYAAAAAAYHASADLIPTKAALTNLAICLRYTSDLEGSSAAARKALTLPTHGAVDEVMNAVALLQLGSTLALLGKPDEARAQLTEALHRFQRLKDSRNHAAAEYQLGSTAYRIGDTKTAMSWFESAHRRFVFAHDAVGEGITLNALGVVKLDAGATDEGLRLLAEAVVLFRQTGDLRNEAGSLMNMASGRQDKCELEQAFKAFQECAVAAKHAGDLSLAAQATANAANALLESGDSAAVRRVAQDALDICRSVVAPEPQGWAHLYIAGSYNLERQFDKAELEVRLARKSLGGVNAIGVLAANVEEAKIIMGHGNYVAAERMLREADQHARESGFDSLRPGILGLIADTWQARGDKAKVLQALSEAAGVVREHALVNCDARALEKRLRGTT